MDQKMTTEEFRKILLSYIFDTNGDVPQYQLTEKDWEKIHEISGDRYQKWEWNYGRSPKFNLQHSKRFSAGSIDLRLEVKKGMIQDCKIFGDFFGVGDIADIEKRLIGQQYDRKTISDVLEDMDMRHYFGNVSKEDFLDLIY